MSDKTTSRTEPLEGVRDFSKTLTTNKVVKLAAIFSVLLVGFSVFYYFVVFLPKTERARIEKEVRESIKKEEKDKATEGASENLAKESTSILQEQEKVKRDLEQAQAEHERQVREHEAKERERQEQEKRWRAALAGQLSFKLCLAQADAKYQALWNETCIRNGRPAGCGLLSPSATRLDQTHIADRDECYRLYPQH